MNESSSRVAAVVPSSQRQVLRAFGEEVHLRLTGEQAGGCQALWTEITPSGFETFFARCAEEYAKPGSPDMGRIAAISAEHGIHFVEP
jgi:hypothetical protein